MHFLARFRVLTKILGIVAMLTVLLGTVAYLAIAALAAQNDNAETDLQQRRLLSH